MGKFVAIFNREYMERVRSRWFVVATVFGPILMLALIFVPSILGSRTGASEDVGRVAILDATGTHIGRRMALSLSGGLAGDTSLTRIVPVTAATLAPAESAATAEVMAGGLQGYFVLDSGTVQGRSARYAGRNASSISDLERLRAVVRQSVLAYRLEAAGLDPSRVDELTSTRLSLDAERLNERGRGGSGMVSVLFGIFVAMLLYVAILLYGMSVLRGVQEEKQTRVAEVVLSSARSDTLLAGKVLGIGAVGLTQMLAWVVAAALLFRYRATLLGMAGLPNLPFSLPDIGIGMLVVLLFFFLAGFILYASLLAAVGAMVNNEQEAQQAAQPVIFLMIAAMLFLQPVLQNPNSRLAEVVSWIPFTAPIIMPLRMTLTTVSMVELILVLAGIAITCALAVWLAARIYRVGLLMYGKRPTMRELARWIRRAA